MFTGILQEELEHWLYERRDVHLELLTHGLHYLLYQQDDGVLDGTRGAPELLQGQDKGGGVERGSTA